MSDDGKWYPCDNCGKVVFAFVPDQEKYSKRKGYLMLAWHRHSDGWRDHDCEQAYSMVLASECYDTKEEAQDNLHPRQVMTVERARMYGLF